MEILAQSSTSKEAANKSQEKPKYGRDQDRFGCGSFETTAKRDCVVGFQPRPTATIVGTSVQACGWKPVTGLHPDLVVHSVRNC